MEGSEVSAASCSLMRRRNCATETTDTTTFYTHKHTGKRSTCIYSVSYCCLSSCHGDGGAASHFALRLLAATAPSSTWEEAFHNPPYAFAVPTYPLSLLPHPSHHQQQHLQASIMADAGWTTVAAKPKKKPTAGGPKPAGVAQPWESRPAASASTYTGGGSASSAKKCR